MKNEEIVNPDNVNKVKGVFQGLHEYLAEGTSVAPYLLKTPVKKLGLLPAGRPSSNPSELLSSDKMRLLIQELRSRYQDRYIIADFPPAAFAADTASAQKTLCAQSRRAASRCS